MGPILRNRPTSAHVPIPLFRDDYFAIWGSRLETQHDSRFCVFMAMAACFHQWGLGPLRKFSFPFDHSIFVHLQNYVAIKLFNRGQFWQERESQSRSSVFRLEFPAYFTLRDRTIEEQANWRKCGALSYSDHLQQWHQSPWKYEVMLGNLTNENMV